MLLLCTLRSKQVLRILKDIGQKLLLSSNPQFSLLFYKESVAAKGRGLGGGGGIINQILVNLVKGLNAS